MPPYPDDRRLPGDVVTKTSAVVHDPTGDIHLAKIHWYETHGRPFDGGLILPSEIDHGPETLPEIPESAETVRVAVVATLDREVTADAQHVKLSFGLPAGAIFDGCETGWDFTCSPVQASGDERRRYGLDNWIVAEGTMHPQYRNSPIEIILMADFHGVEGIALADHRTDATVRGMTPLLDFGKEPIDSRTNGQPVETGTFVEFDKANAINWATRPDSGGDALQNLGGKGTARDVGPSTTIHVATADIVSWTWHTLPWVLVPPVKGTKDWVTRHDTDDLFDAGIAFGVTGAAATILLQLLAVGGYRLWRARHP
ncbi:hypothetical protein A5657_03000 [Mycobacterium kubicae]|nr:hypothetical protein A5657_03000 [Mycobacterium kubicae]